MQPHTGRGVGARAQPAGVGEHQRRRQFAFDQQALRPVQVLQHGFEQSRALVEAGFEGRKLVGGERQRHRVAAPRPLRRATARQHRRDALLGVGAIQPARALRQFVADHGERAQQPAPVRADAVGAVHHLVEGGLALCRRAHRAHLRGGCVRSGRASPGCASAPRRRTSSAPPRRSAGCG